MLTGPIPASKTVLEKAELNINKNPATVPINPKVTMVSEENQT